MLASLDGSARRAHHPRAVKDTLIDTLEALDVQRCFVFRDAPSALTAVLVIDDVTLGPAAGGVRTWHYASAGHAAADAAGLARAMTLKCALAGLDAGGGKMVVMDHPGLDRARAFSLLGERVEELGGLFRTAGDLGTRGEDVETMARHTRFAHTDEGGLAASVARGLRRSVEAAAAISGRTLDGLGVAVQGAGAIGGAVARELAAHGARVLVADTDEAKARALAHVIDADVTSASSVLLSDVDVIAPCAVGGVVDRELASRLTAWCVCGAANGILASEEAAEELRRRGILHVPDEIASAGAVVDGIGRTVMGLTDRNPLIDKLGDTAREVLERAEAEAATPSAVATRIAWERIAARRGR